MMLDRTDCPSERFDDPHDAVTAYTVRMGDKAKPLWLTTWRGKAAVVDHLAALLCELPIE